MDTRQACPQRTVDAAFQCWCATGCDACRVYGDVRWPAFPGSERLSVPLLVAYVAMGLGLVFLPATLLRLLVTWLS